MRVLYKSGKTAKVWGISFAHCTVEDHEVEDLLAQGWVKNPLELLKKVEEPVVKQTRTRKTKAVKNED